MRHAKGVIVRYMLFNRLLEQILHKSDQFQPVCEIGEQIDDLHISVSQDVIGPRRIRLLEYEGRSVWKLRSLHCWLILVKSLHFEMALKKFYPAIVRSNGIAEAS